MALTFHLPSSGRFLFVFVGGPLFNTAGIQGVKQQTVPVFWATQAEERSKLNVIMEKDENRIIKVLAQRACKPSIACSIFLGWKVGRGKKREILKRLGRNRRLQTTFGDFLAIRDLQVSIKRSSW